MGGRRKVGFLKMGQWSFGVCRQRG